MKLATATTSGITSEFRYQLDHGDEAIDYLRPRDPIEEPNRLQNEDNNDEQQDQGEKQPGVAQQSDDSPPALDPSSLNSDRIAPLTRGTRQATTRASQRVTSAAGSPISRSA